MKICAECKSAKLKQKPGKMIRFCQKLKELCINAREAGKECGPDGKLWEQK